MSRAIALVLLIAFAGCASPHPNTPFQPRCLTPAETRQVEFLLADLYRSFSYADGDEPDWELMRSLFVDGAQFVTEPPAGEAPRPQSVDAFISSWQASIRDRETPTVGTFEWITDARMTRVGALIRADVAFLVEKRDDPAPRQPGFDSLVLIQDGSAWKVLTFVVHYESKLAPDDTEAVE